LIARWLGKPKGASPVERLPLDSMSPWWGEHRSRYRFAQPHVAGKRVLEIACGTGFGSHMLAEAGAKSVVGVDVTVDAVAAASRAFASPHVHFLQGDGTALPFADDTFDVVTSFETIEHIPKYPVFVKELRRVTTAGGHLILSTPNALLTSQYPRNPFHVHEFVPEELQELLRQYYQRVELRGQLVARYYHVVPFLPGKDRAQCFLDHFRLVAWKIANRLPFRIKDTLALAVTGRHFYPSELDYCFELRVEGAPVMVAICQT
jgi:ubiquinone/menaquinone biosynthesis C-methylase UbiE